MVYTTMLIALAVMPMMIISIEIVRMMFVNVHLQSVVDAACAAASQAVDVPHFILTGELIIDPIEAAANAQAEFNNTVATSDTNKYSPTLGSLSIPDGTVDYCQSSAVMIWMLPGIAPVVLTAETVAETRARR
jgi:hypothetical protein